ncbi:MAG: response regulator, partial [Myxococcota bacterium]|nr:response regulator [Myxococcota bacterium]
PEGAHPADVPERLASRLRDLEEGRPLDPDRLRRDLLTAGRSLHALFRTPDEHWLRLASKALPGRSGGTAEVLVRLRDETPLHRVSEALAEQAATLDAVLASSGDGILVVDWPDGRVRYVNRPFVEVVGLRGHPRVGDDAETVRRQVHAAVRDPEAIDALIDRGLREPRTLVPIVVGTRDGRVVEGSGRPVLREGRVVARLFQVRDVTERRRAEDAVRLSQKLESLSVMAGGIAHDFNNVLVSVLGNAELARDTLPEDAEARGPLGEVESAAQRASDLTRQLLAYAGRSEVDPRDVDISAVTRDALSMIGASIPRTVRVETSLAATPPAVVGDPAQLHQVAMNLVLNAAEALGPEGGGVRVETGVAYVSRDTRIVGIDGEVSPSRPLVFLRVADDGPGMDAETRERIFDPFFTTKRSGRGLGLAATLGIVRSHGGNLQVESEPGEGSVFTALLPSTGRAVRSPARGPAEPERPWSGEGCVLVVDDEPGVLRVARRILEGAGFAVETAEDGTQALERWDARGGGYRAVLLDLTMPRLSGEETWRELRKRDPEVPVLFSSGYPEARSRLGAGVAGRSADRSGFVAKPYTRAVLLEALRALLEPPGGAGPEGLR